MAKARDAAATCTPRVVSLQRPFSNFQFVDENYEQGHAALRRLFSQSRAARATALVIEDISATGALADEERILRELDADYQCPLRQRLTFWRRPPDGRESLPEIGTPNLLGYALVKRDVMPSRGVDAVHVFESVFRKHAHPHNCPPGEVHPPRPSQHPAPVAGTAAAGCGCALLRAVDSQRGGELDTRRTTETETYR